MIRTKRGARRRYNAIINKCYKDSRGGTKFGVDLPTIFALWPDRANELRNISFMFDKLPK